jgi:hypothetical protein
MPDLHLRVMKRIEKKLDPAHEEKMQVASCKLQVKSILIFSS